MIYLIDTGSDISLLPADSKTLKKKPSDIVLFAANDSRVPTFGEINVTLNLNLRRAFKWNFCVAQVPYPIIGADLLAHFHLVPYLHESRLVDTTTGLSSSGFLKSASICGLSLINQSHVFSKILAFFPELLSVPQRVAPSVGDVKNHILTSGPPVFERARRLSPEKLAAAKIIFRQMVEDGICRPCSSPWATPIHMIRKKSGEWRVCGDFRRLNAITNFQKPKTICELRRFLGMVNFYRKSLPRAAEIQAPLQKFLCDSRKNDKRPVIWDPEADAAFEQVKHDLANAAILSHPSHDAKIRLVTDASNFGMGASLEQYLDDTWKLLGFFSRKFSNAQRVYSAYNRELTAIYEAIRNFRYFLEGQSFTIVTDHKPLTYMFSQRVEKISQRQQRQIAFISQFTTDINYQPGSENVVADSLSRVESIRVPTEFSLLELAQAQSDDNEIRNLVTDPNCSLTIRKIQWGPEHTSIYCDLTGEALRPIIPLSLRGQIFQLFHNQAHPSAKVTDRVIRKRYVWPSMRRDISDWCKACPECQQSKISRHNRLLPSQITAPDGRFRHVHMDIVGPFPVSNGFRYCLTVIDRFSRWPEAVPLSNIEALTVCRAFFDNWVSRYGAPETLTTDQGGQFESQLFAALLQLIGCNRIRTTAYHPASNGMIERWHRSLKAAIMCHSDREWSRSLSTVLLGLRTNVLDIGSSPAEFVFGTTL